MVRTRLITALGLFSVALVGVAHAQGSSEVQVYGQASIGVNNRNNAITVPATEVGQNLLSVAFVGFRGAEDLGGGKKAIYSLEGNLAIDSGLLGANVAGGPRAFNRQSFVGLDLGSAGALTLGRQFHAATDRAIRSFDVYNVAGANAHVAPLALFGVNRFYGNDSRVDNSIKYRLKGPSGFEAAVSYGMSEGVTGDSYSVDISRVTEAYTYGVSYVSFGSPNVIATTGVRPKHEVLSIGGNAVVGTARLYAAYFQSRLGATVATGLTQNNDILSLGVAWNSSPNNVVKVAYVTDRGVNMSGVAGRDGRKNTLVVSNEYFLSRRTSLSAMLFQNNLSSGYLLDPVNQSALGRSAAVSSVRGYSLGMIHRF